MVLRSEGWRGEAFEDNGVRGVRTLFSTEASLSTLLVKSEVSLSGSSDSAYYISRNHQQRVGPTNHSQCCICWYKLSLHFLLRWAPTFFCGHIEAP